MTVRLVVAMMCVARIARGDAPVTGHVALGLRGSSTSEPHYDDVYDKTGSVRAALEGLVGLRLGPAVVGMHVGLGTPLSFYGSPLADSGEQVAQTKSRIYPIDLGLGAQVDVGAGVWLSAWFGATVSLMYGTSPAMHVSAIDFTGDIPAASWSDRTTSLGYGAAVGYDVTKTEYGRIAGYAAFEAQGIARVPLRDNDGQTGSDKEDLTTLSVTVGMAYRY